MTPRAYYSEFEPYAAQWLRNLIARGILPDGDVDERDIRDVRPADIAGFTQCHFFAGLGGWPYALRLAGWPDDRCVWSGSVPCQPWSIAGKGEGASDERHLWPHWFGLVRQCNPAVLFGEQVVAAIGRGWWDAVASDLDNAGYASGAVDLPAAAVGAPHIRRRLWFVADTGLDGLDGCVGGELHGASSRRLQPPVGRPWWAPEPRVRRVDDGTPGRVGRLRAIGNAIVPQVAQVFIEAYADARGIALPGNPSASLVHGDPLVKEAVDAVARKGYRVWSLSQGLDGLWRSILYNPVRGAEQPFTGTGIGSTPENAVMAALNTDVRASLWDDELARLRTPPPVIPDHLAAAARARMAVTEMLKAALQ